MAATDGAALRPRRRPLRRGLLAALGALVALAALGLRLGPATEAEDRAEAGVFVHTDSDQLTVVHPYASTRLGLDEGHTFSASYEADVITAATVDVRTAASPRAFEETRHGASLGLDLALSRLARAGLSASLSISPDYETYSVASRFVLEDEDRQHTLSFAFGVAHDQVGRVWQEGAVGEALSIGASASWAALLGPRAILDLGGGLEHQRGFLESPYRRIPIELGGSERLWLPEALPDGRLRGALSARLRWSPVDPLFLDARYRFHADDWGVAGHTVEARVSFEPEAGWLLSVSGRLLEQRGASFYRGRYVVAGAEELPGLRTRDRELAPGHSLGAGLRLSFCPGSIAGLRLCGALRGGFTFRRYLDTPYLPERWSLTSGLGFSGDW